MRGHDARYTAVSPTSAQLTRRSGGSILAHFARPLAAKRRSPRSKRKGHEVVEADAGPRHESRVTGEDYSSLIDEREKRPDNDRDRDAARERAPRKHRR